MNSFSLEIVASNNYNLNETLDKILDGELNEIAVYEDVSAEVGSASLLGMGEPPTIKIIVQFKDDPKDTELPKKLVKQIEKLLGPRGSVHFVVS